MEVERNFGPEENFLEKVRKLADEKNIILIFDECTSGFRETFEIHLKYGVYPDMAMYGKTLGNGYAITAVVGKKEIMEVAQDTFISSTFWTERIGPTAALKTLEVMDRIKSSEIITETGIQVNKIWKKIAEQSKISINISGIPSLTSFTFENSCADYYKTYLTQEMLEKGFLAGTSFYGSIAHKKNHLKYYSIALAGVFEMISKFRK